MNPTPIASNENMTPPAVLPKEVKDAIRTEDQIRIFSADMNAKMHRHQGKFEPWNERTWNKKELDLAIVNSILDGDYVSAGNYAMMANAIQNVNGSNFGVADEVCGASPGNERRGG